jgi:hypothetical protein
MNTYRVTVMVTLDVSAVDDGAAAGMAISRVQDTIGDSGQHGREMWVTGIGRHSIPIFNEEDLMIYEQQI